MPIKEESFRIGSGRYVQGPGYLAKTWDEIRRLGTAPLIIGGKTALDRPQQQAGKQAHHIAHMQPGRADGCGDLDLQESGGYIDQCRHNAGKGQLLSCILFHRNPSRNFLYSWIIAQSGNKYIAKINI